MKAYWIAHVTVTDAPGWGVEINPEWLAKSSYSVSDWAR